MARRTRTLERRFIKRVAPDGSDQGARALEVWSRNPDGSEVFKGGQVKTGGAWSETITDLAEYQEALKSMGVSDG